MCGPQRAVYVIILPFPRTSCWSVVSTNRKQRPGISCTELCSTGQEFQREYGMSTEFN